MKTQKVTVLQQVIEHSLGKTSADSFQVYACIRYVHATRELKQSVICAVVSLVGIPVTMILIPVLWKEIPRSWENMFVALALIGLFAFVGRVFFKILDVLEAEKVAEPKLWDLKAALAKFKKLFGSYPDQLGLKKTHKKLVGQALKVRRREVGGTDKYDADQKFRAMYAAAQEWFSMLTTPKTLFADANARLSKKQA